MNKWKGIKALRYKRPALASMGFEQIRYELDDIADVCYDVHWYEENDETTLINAMNGDSDELWEFKMAFSNMEGNADRLREILYSYNYGPDGRKFGEYYDDCTVALVGNRYKLIGYDSDEEDYMALTNYEENLAQTEAGKRLMRLTKAEMISTIGQCFGILIAFLDLRYSYDYLKATLDIIRDEYTSLLNYIRSVNSAYDAAEKTGFDSSSNETRKFDTALAQIPDLFWLG